MKEKIGQIFQQDYIVLAQEYIEPQRQIKLLMYNGHIVYVYEWDKGESKIVSSNSYKQMVNKLYSVWPIQYAGLDIIEDLNGKLWLIEVNSAPAIPVFYELKENEMVFQTYEHIFKGLFSSPMKQLIEGKL